MHDYPINGQQSYYSVLSDDQIHPSDTPQCTPTPVKSLGHKSEKSVSKPENKLTIIIVNTQSINSKNEIWKVIDTRKPEIAVMSETLEEEEVCLIRVKEQVGEKRSTVC